MTPRVVGIIQARMTSTRLPGKVLLPAVGTPLLQLMIERLRRAERLDDVWVATTDQPASDPIEALARELGAGCFRGSEEDVLSRVLGTAEAAGADVIVETTGDCPLIDPAVVDRVVDAYLAGDVDYASNVLRRTYPRGLDTQVFPTAVLAEVDALTQDPADREHVSLYIYEHPERYRLRNVESGHPGSAELRLTVDTPEDLELVREVFSALHPSNPAFGLEDMLALFRERPELAAINREIRQKPAR